VLDRKLAGKATPNSTLCPVSRAVIASWSTNLPGYQPEPGNLQARRRFPLSSTRRRGVTTSPHLSAARRAYLKQEAVRMRQIRSPHSRSASRYTRKAPLMQAR